MSTLTGRVAVVTGGGHGVGRGIALALAGAGASVAVCGRTQETLTAVRLEIEARGGQAEAIVSDIVEPADRARLIERAVARFGGINILVNNAAFVPHGSLLDIADSLIDTAWRTGPMASLQLMRLCHPHLKGDGAIINVSSGAAVAPRIPDRGIYAAVKAAQNAIARAAAMEWAADGIRVNTIMPMASTEATDRFFAREPARAAASLSNIPLGRMGDCEHDIGPVAVFLAGVGARYLTGQTLMADGGAGYVR